MSDTITFHEVAAREGYYATTGWRRSLRRSARTGRICMETNTAALTKWYTKLWHPWGPTIGFNQECFLSYNGTTIASIRRFFESREPWKRGRPLHYVVSTDDWNAPPANSLKEAVDRALKNAKLSSSTPVIINIKRLRACRMRMPKTKKGD